MNSRKVTVNSKKHHKSKKRYFLALPIYLIYVFVFELYFGYGISELWNRIKKITKVGKKKIKRKSKFIRLQMREI